jgi:hypothetical protein
MAWGESAKKFSLRKLLIHKLQATPGVRPALRAALCTGVPNTQVCVEVIDDEQCDP